MENEPIIQNGEVSPESNPQTPWYQQAGISPEITTDKIKGFKDINAFVQSYNESQSFIGKGVPDENTPDDIKNAFYEKLGRPKSADLYDWNLPDGLTVEGATNENFKAFKQICFDAGMSNKQVNAVLGHWSKTMQDLLTQQASAREEIATTSKRELSAQWGDKFDTKMNAIMKRIDELGIRPHLEAAGVLFDKNVLKAFDSVISASRETGIRGADGKFATPEERLNQLKAHPAYYNAGLPEHQALINEANQIYAQMGS